MKKALKKKRPETITDELNEIMRMNKGFIDPVKVVEYARKPNTLLHKRFEWDDGEAAIRYRIWQARMIIRVELVAIPEYRDGEKVKAFISLVEDRYGDGEKGYRSMVDILTDDELRFKMLEDARGELRSFKRKYDMLKELAEIFEAIDKVL